MDSFFLLWKIRILKKVLDKVGKTWYNTMVMWLSLGNVPSAADGGEGEEKRVAVTRRKNE